MNLKNPEIFRTWLIRQLEPICKANPEPVSKYVCALLKKDTSDGELKNNLISQLYIFLHAATEEFVNFLIDVLENEKYLTNDADFRVAESTDSTKENEEKVEKQVKKEEVAESASTVEKDKERKSPSPIQAPSPSPPKKVPFQKSSPVRSRRNRFRNERRRVGTRKSRRDSSHSDSPGPERQTLPRKRSASGSSESSNKSPRRSWIASRPLDVKKYKHNKNFTRSPAGPRSRSKSPKMKRRKQTNGNFCKKIRTYTHSNSDDEGAHVNKRMPSYQVDKSNRDMLLMAKDLPQVEPHFEQKQRCLDFEGKGYCARGDMCPYDHGPSPIVLDNNILNGMVPLPPPMHRGPFPEPNIYTPQFVNPSNFPPAKHFRPDNPPLLVSKRELIPVPTLPLPPHKHKHLNAGKPSYGHIFSSIPPGVSQTTIELTNIPAELNNIPDLYENFSSFGNLTLIQAKRNGDPGTALLTYTNATEAVLAFLNVGTAVPNAKAAWYADKCILKPFPRKSIPASNNQNNAAKSYVLKRGPPAASAMGTVATNDVNNQPIVNKSTMSPSAKDVAKAASNENKEKGQVRTQDAGSLLSSLIKMKRGLLDKQVASRKEIQEKIKSMEKGSQEEKACQDILNKLNERIAEGENSIKDSLQQRKEYLQKMNIVPMDSVVLNNLKQDPKSSAQVPAPGLVLTSAPPKAPTVPKTDRLEEADQDPAKHLDTASFKIDLESSSAMNQDLEDEKDENGTPSKGSSQMAKNDNKAPPQVGTGEFTRVVVSGFENGDEEELIEHFSQFGKILDKEIDNTIPSATLIYDSRKCAETAKKEGRIFQDRMLTVTVYGSKKFMPALRRMPAFKPQEYVAPFSQFSSNPYKYKNPQIANPSPSPAPRTPAVAPVVAVPLPPASQNVYSYRAEQKNRLSNVKTEEVVDNSTIKLTDDEDLVTFLQKGGIDAKEVEKYMD